MIERPFFTIIIPCYNAEKTLQEAVLSVTNQDFQDLEVIIVDDASKDWSFVLAHNLADEDERIRVIALADNNGPAEARNKGIDEALGRYIMFLDSDDVFDAGLLSAVYKECTTKCGVVKGKSEPADGEGPDVVIWGNREEIIDSKGAVIGTKEIHCKPFVYTDERELRGSVMDLEEQSLYGYLWNKAYKRASIGDVRIPDQAFNEDEMFNIMFFDEAKSAVAIDLLGTVYRKRGTSLTHRELVNYYPIAMKRIAGLMQQHKLWSMYTDDVHTRIANLYVRYVLSTIERLYRPAMGYSQKGRLLFMQRIFASKLYREMVPYMKPNNLLLGRFAKALGKKNAKKCLKIGKLIHQVKETLPGMFEKAK